MIKEWNKTTPSVARRNTRRPTARAQTRQQRDVLVHTNTPQMKAVTKEAAIYSPSSSTLPLTEELTRSGATRRRQVGTIRKRQCASQSKALKRQGCKALRQRGAEARRSTRHSCFHDRHPYTNCSGVLGFFRTPQHPCLSFGPTNRSTWMAPSRRRRH